METLCYLYYQSVFFLFFYRMWTVAVWGQSSRHSQSVATTSRDWRWTLLFPRPNDPAISRQLRWTNRNHSSRSEFINCRSVTSHKKYTQAERGSAAWLFFFFSPSSSSSSTPWPLNINQTTRHRHRDGAPPRVSLLVRKEYANKDLDPNQIPDPVR